MRDRRPSDRPELFKAAVAGAAAGIVGSWTMTMFHMALHGRGLSGGTQPQNVKLVEGRDDPAMKTADIVAQSVGSRPLTHEEKIDGASLAHYAFGASTGAVWGVLRELAPESSLTEAGPMAVAVWLGADEAALPILGLSKPPDEYPASVHITHLFAHLVYGYTTKAVFDRVRSAL